jgi:hypothetical protein
VRSIQVVIDVGREGRIRFGVVERRGEKNLGHRLVGRLDASGSSERFGEGLAHEVAERRPARSRHLRRATVKLRRKEQLGPVHV